MSNPQRVPFPAAAKRIQARLDARGLDVAKLARLADVNPSTARDAIAGRNVTVGVAVEIARALGVRVEHIWNGPRPKRADARNARTAASVEGA